MEFLIKLEDMDLPVLSLSHVILRLDHTVLFSPL
jgi:hypothetical protein